MSIVNDNNINNVTANVTNTTWQTLIINPNYEISVDFPYNIRRKHNNRYCCEYFTGQYVYYTVTLDGKRYKKHDVIAYQWLGYTHDKKHKDKLIIDHINKNRMDNHLNNLRIATSSQNAKNRTKYAKTHILPQDAVIHNSKYPHVYYSPSFNQFYVGINNKNSKNNDNANTTYNIYLPLYNPQANEHYVIIPQHDKKQYVYLRQ